MDVTTPENLKILGFTSLDDYKARVDAPTFELLRGMRNVADQAVEARNVEQIRVQLDALLTVMDASKVEQRYDLAKEGLLTREDIMQAFRAVLPPQQLKAAALQP